MANENKENTEIEKTFDELTAEEQVAVLKAALTAEQTKREAAEKSLSDEINDHKESNKKSLEIITALKEKLDVTSEIAKNGKALTVTHNKKEYQILINSFKLDGVSYTAKDLQEKPEVVAKLIKLGSGVLSN